MRYFSAFSGIGGFEIGIQNAYREALRREQTNTSRDDEKGQGLVSSKGQDISSANRQSSERSTNLLDERSLCVGYSEIDKWADRVYKYHFKGVKNYGDITKIKAEELPDFDCLVGGFPCQAFSIAGKRGGFSDTRGTLFFDLARILREKQPRLFVFENVKGLLSHDRGKTFKTIISTLYELGYDVQWQVLNSKDFGVPQNRERVIIVGNLRTKPRPEVFPIQGTDSEDTEQSVPVGTLRTFKDGNGFRDTKSGLAPTLPARARADGSGQPAIKVYEATSKGYAEATVGQSINLSVPNSKTRRGRVSDVAQTLDTGMQQYTLTEDVRIRRLTPLECERLQGFPDYWTMEGCDENLACSVCIEQFGVAEDDYIAHECGGTRIIEISDTQRYKMCGNAVTTNVIQAVFERILSNELH